MVDLNVDVGRDDGGGLNVVCENFVVGKLLIVNSDVKGLIVYVIVD